MIPVTTIITKLNNLITAGGLTELELAQVFGAIVSLENNGVNSVTTVNDLPPASDNKGRFFYITSDNDYVFSNGTIWGTSNLIKEVATNSYGWGNNASGRLGINSTIDQSSPVSISGNFSDWTQLSAGWEHSLGIRANGTAWAWGLGTLGRLGNNSTASSRSPISVVGGITDWVQVSAGGSHSLGVRAGGTAFSWGSNGNGQLGANLTTSTSRSSPTFVAGNFTDWVQVSASRFHSLGIRANGTAWSWGSNYEATLGDFTRSDRSSPVTVVGGFTDWIQVSAGHKHSLGLRADGTAWAWGYNGNGQLGIGTFIGRESSPVSVVGGFTDWTQLSAGNSHSLGLRANGTAWAWGWNTSGQLGDGTATSRNSPVSVVGGFTDWVQVSSNFLGSFSTAVKADGTVWAWGDNSNGQLGNSTTTTRSSPVSVIGGFTDWIQISAGTYHSLGVRS